MNHRKPHNHNVRFGATSVREVSPSELTFPQVRPLSFLQNARKESRLMDAAMEEYLNEKPAPLTVLEILTAMGERAPIAVRVGFRVNKAVVQAMPGDFYNPDSDWLCEFVHTSKLILAKRSQLVPATEAP